MATPYVKFQRGTPEIFEKLDSPNKNTLYFISDSNGKDGKLYLGSKLIAGSTIGDLSDTTIEDPSDGSILVYNSDTEKWECITADSFLKKSTLVRIMRPASSSTDGLAGYVPQPLAGDETKFLSGAGIWTKITATITEDDKSNIIEELKDEIQTISWGQLGEK